MVFGTGVCAAPLAADPSGTSNGFVFSVAVDGRLTSVSAEPSSLRSFSDHDTSAPDRLFLFEAPEVPAASLASTVPAPHAAPVSPSLLNAIEATALRYAGHAALRRAGLSVTDWALLYRANIEVESAYDPEALSHAGAIGLGQLMPGTARDLAVDPHDIAQNLDGSARYLLMMLGQFGEPSLALAAYNAGPAAVTRHGGIPPFPETQTHVVRVSAVFARLRGDLS